MYENYGMTVYHESYGDDGVACKHYHHYPDRLLVESGVFMVDSLTINLMMMILGDCDDDTRPIDCRPLDRRLSRTYYCNDYLKPIRPVRGDSPSIH